MLQDVSFLIELARSDVVPPRKLITQSKHADHVPKLHGGSTAPGTMYPEALHTSDCCTEIHGGNFSDFDVHCFRHDPSQTTTELLAALKHNAQLTI